MIGKVKKKPSTKIAYSSVAVNKTQKGKKKGYGERKNVYIFRAKYCLKGVSLVA